MMELDPDMNRKIKFKATNLKEFDRSKKRAVVIVV